jgi:hypothetical protein
MSHNVYMSEVPGWEARLEGSALVVKYRNIPTIRDLMGDFGISMDDPWPLGLTVVGSSTLKLNDTGVRVMAFLDSYQAQHITKPPLATLLHRYYYATYGRTLPDEDAAAVVRAWLKL